MDETVHTLVISSNPGRYALDDSEYGADLTSGMSISIEIGGVWIAGRVEHSGRGSAGTYTVTGVTGERIGYYFISTSGQICGLCTGMRVRR